VRDGDAHTGHPCHRCLRQSARPGTRLTCNALHTPRALLFAVLVAWRSRRATLIRFAAPMMFLLLALVMQVALDASLAAEGRYRPTRTGIHQDIKSIPDCNQDLYIHDRPCATLIFSPNTSVVVMVSRGGRPRGAAATWPWRRQHPWEDGGRAKGSDGVASCKGNGSSSIAELFLLPEQQGCLVAPQATRAVLAQHKPRLRRAPGHHRAYPAQQCA
jgi:hypothetical protein